jgi:DNA-binding transcriptional MerR regulator
MNIRELLIDSGLNPNKNYYKIGELSKILNVRTSVIRFWESEFKVKTIKNTAHQRVYTKENMEFFIRLHKLLYLDQYTIPGAKKILMENAEGGEHPAETNSTHGLKPQSPSSPAVSIGQLETIRQKLEEIKLLLNETYAQN